MADGRDDDKTWAELVDAFHADPDPDDGTQRWPAAEDIGPDEGQHDSGRTDDAGLYDDEPSGSHHTTMRDWDESPPSPARSDVPAGAGQHPAGMHRPEPYGREDEDGDHFVPPTPPPIPRGDRVTRWAWTGMLAAPSVFLLSSITGWSPPDGLLMVLVGGFIAGFGTLVARMRGRNPHDPDNGAIV